MSDLQKATFTICSCMMLVVVLMKVPSIVAVIVAPFMSIFFMTTVLILGRRDSGKD